MNSGRAHRRRCARPLFAYAVPFHRRVHNVRRRLGEARGVW
ncbi:hypothetical protein BPSOL_1425 [Bifidobacterium pseudolongum]|nr:hypothetical protein BPSOL_1425 [Bifidobacterium pseudolongum]